MFNSCQSLRVVWVEDYHVDSARKIIGDHVVMSRLQMEQVLQTTIGKVRLQDQWSLRSVVIPEGLEKVGSYWFIFSDIESVEIPGSVTEIGAGAFY